MFVQVFQGTVTDAGRARQALEDWVARLAPDADGWLGSTVGVSDDGVLIGLARFGSAEAARRNSGRAQQGEWWSGVEKLFSEGAAFHDCSEVDLGRGGGSDEAGFVQVIQGRVRDVARMRELTATFDDRLSGVRPELLGLVAAHHDGEDGVTQAVYFTSEQAARTGEHGELPAQAVEGRRELMALLEDVRFFDLRDPWLYSPR